MPWKIWMKWLFKDYRVLVVSIRCFFVSFCLFSYSGVCSDRRKLSLFSLCDVIVLQKNVPLEIGYHIEHFCAFCDSNVNFPSSVELFLKTMTSQTESSIWRNILHCTKTIKKKGKKYNGDYSFWCSVGVLLPPLWGPLIVDRPSLGRGVWSAQVVAPTEHLIGRSMQGPSIKGFLSNFLCISSWACSCKILSWPSVTVISVSVSFTFFW